MLGCVGGRVEEGMEDSCVLGLLFFCRARRRRLLGRTSRKSRWDLGCNAEGMGLNGPSVPDFSDLPEARETFEMGGPEIVTSAQSNKPAALN